MFSNYKSYRYATKMNDGGEENVLLVGPGSVSVRLAGESYNSWNKGETI